MDYAQQLRDLSKKHDFLVCFDSDGCVFDTMEIKHKECFCPAFIKHMNLAAASKYAREIWDFVNLYGKTRGCNRFVAIKHALTWAGQRPEISNRSVSLPDLSALNRWMATETKLGNPALSNHIRGSGDNSLKRFLDWSIEVNERISDMVHGLAPFPHVREVLEYVRSRADILVVSQTPLEALDREWAENGLTGFVDLIAGQEHGTKTEHIALAIDGKGYAKTNVLMVGDAPGDLVAAKENRALFFPILPGQEDESWLELATKGIERFFKKTFEGEYQQNLLKAFDAVLPTTPPWVQT